MRIEEVVVDGEPLIKLLASGGRSCDRIADTVCRSQVRVDFGSFPLLVRVHDGYLEFAIVPFLKSPEDDALSAKLYTRLLRLNHDLLMASFAIDDDLDIVLSVEHPLADLDRSEVEDALSVLGYYAGEHYRELAEMAGVRTSARAAES